MNHLYSDANLRDLHAITRIQVLPSYVAEYQEPKTASIHDDECADDTGHRYPLHNKAATWLSAAYFSLRKAAGTDTEAFPGQHMYITANIKRAAGAYGIADDVGSVMRKISEAVELQRTAAQIPDDAYGLVYQGKIGETIRRFPMLDAEGVRKAAAAYATKRAGLERPHREAVANSVIRKAAQFGVPQTELSDILWADAGQALATPGMIAAEIEKRAALVTDDDVIATLRKLASQVRATPAAEIDALDIPRIEQLLGSLDATYGLHSKYGSELLEPSLAVRTIPVYKAAAMRADEVTIAGRRMKLATLALVPVTVYQAALGSAADVLGDAPDTTKLAALLGGLTDEQQLVLHAELKAQLQAG